tara:strand:- start:1480 stop:1665 length:186 start_codon:yes stop_codon:yes gene_type:complete
MAILFFSTLFLIIVALLAFVIHIDYYLDNPPNYPQTEAEANVYLLKMRISQANKKIRNSQL